MSENFLVAAAILLGSFTAPTIAAESPDAPTDSDAVLARFLGEWKTHTHIIHAGPPHREFDTLGKAACGKTLAGRYFEFRSESIPPGESDLQIMTYDTDAGLFRQWVFSSDGYTHEADGKWDPATSTLRWTGKTADASFIILDHWTSSDHLEWTLERTDSSGTKLQTIRGTLERAK